MSMLSEQCDKLRERAAIVDGLSPALASELRMAADTIWELRNVGAENAKLRELVRDLWQYIYVGTARDGQRLHDRTRELGIEVSDHERD